MIRLKKRKREKMNVRPDPAVRCRGHLQFVRGHECAVAGRLGACFPFDTIEAHHIYVPGDAKGKKPPDSRTVPLCPLHHEEVGRTLGKETFERRYQIDLLEVAAELWKLSPHRLKHERKIRELTDA